MARRTWSRRGGVHCRLFARHCVGRSRRASGEVGAVEIGPDRPDEFRLLLVQRFDLRIAMDAAHRGAVDGGTDALGERDGAEIRHETVEGNVFGILDGGLEHVVRVTGAMRHGVPGSTADTSQTAAKGFSRRRGSRGEFLGVKLGASDQP